MKKKNWITAAIVILAIALAVVVGVIIWRQAEYAQSAEFYRGLRG